MNKKTFEAMMQQGLDETVDTDKIITGTQAASSAIKTLTILLRTDRSKGITPPNSEDIPPCF